MRKEALALYRLAVEKEARYVENTEYANLRIKALSTPAAEEEIIPYEEEPVAEDQMVPLEEQPAEQ